jgi:hypothetical protein
VSFRLTGPGFSDTPIGAGTPDGTGHWTLERDSHLVSNGTYTLNSAAFDTSGNVGRSPDVTVTVAN